MRDGSRHTGTLRTKNNNRRTNQKRSYNKHKVIKEVKVEVKTNSVKKDSRFGKQPNKTFSMRNVVISMKS